MKTKKQSLWFSHDGNASQDPKLKALLTDYGMEGYGRWWMLLELLRMEDGYRYDVSPGYAWKMLAADLQCTPAKAKAFIKACVEKYHLLKMDGTHLWSESLINRMAYWDGKREKLSERGRKGGETTQKKFRDGQAQVQAQVDLSSSISKANKTKQNETIQNQIKQNESEKLDYSNTRTPDFNFLNGLSTPITQPFTTQPPVTSPPINAAHGYVNMQDLLNKSAYLPNHLNTVPPITPRDTQTGNVPAGGGIGDGGAFDIAASGNGFANAAAAGLAKYGYTDAVLSSAASLPAPSSPLPATQALAEIQASTPTPTSTQAIPPPSSSSPKMPADHGAWMQVEPDPYTPEDEAPVAGALDEAPVWDADDEDMPPFEVREKRFKDEVAQYGELYAHGMADAFIAYWTEPDPNRRFMRFELQDIFDIPRRLKSWEKREMTFNKQRGYSE